MNSSKDFRIVFTTTNTYDSALEISKHLVNEKLAGCCNIADRITSIYSWESEIQIDREYLLIIKTHKDKLEDLETKIRELHSYEIPEIIAFNLSEGSNSYFNWLNNTLGI